MKLTGMTPSLSSFDVAAKNAKTEKAAEILLPFRTPSSTATKTDCNCNRQKAEAHRALFHATRCQSDLRKWYSSHRGKIYTAQLADSQSSKTAKWSRHQKLGRIADLNKGPGDSTSACKCWSHECRFSLSATGCQAAQPPTSALGYCPCPTPNGSSRFPKPQRPLWGLSSPGTDGKQHSPPLVYTSSCRLMFDLSTREWRTLRTLWTFQILGLERRKSISSSDFLAVLQRYWLNDWNCREEGRETEWRPVQNMRPWGGGLWTGRGGPGLLLLTPNCSVRYLFLQSHLGLNWILFVTEHVSSSSAS